MKGASSGFSAAELAAAAWAREKLPRQYTERPIRRRHRPRTPSDDDRIDHPFRGKEQSARSRQEFRNRSICRENHFGRQRGGRMRSDMLSDRSSLSSSNLSDSSRGQARHGVPWLSGSRSPRRGSRRAHGPSMLEAHEPSSYPERHRAARSKNEQGGHRQNRSRRESGDFKSRDGSPGGPHRHGSHMHTRRGRSNEGDSDARQRERKRKRRRQADLQSRQGDGPAKADRRFEAQHATALEQEPVGNALPASTPPRGQNDQASASTHPPAEAPKSALAERSRSPMTEKLAECTSAVDRVDDALKSFAPSGAGCSSTLPVSAGSPFGSRPSLSRSPSRSSQASHSSPRRSAEASAFPRRPPIGPLRTQPSGNIPRRSQSKRQQGKSSRRRARRSRSSSRKHSGNRQRAASPHTPSSPTPVKEPYNPLQEAYDPKGYKQLKQMAGSSARKEPSGKREPKWFHDRYLNRSESPDRERTEGAMWNTRAGSWKSRAGGVYIAPLVLDADEELNGAAKYRNPETTDVIRARRTVAQVEDGRSSPVYDIDAPLE
eukprot:GHVT01018877.1.p1 GENE.GHVT01018877.1~~GHVT01018877.1.p1  ORF type:complete len:546 (+),score=69.06 GHVT01018877.1:311-1948(+)